MNKYDLIVVLACQPDTTTWKFPNHYIACMDKAAELFKQGIAPQVLTSGDRSVSLDNQGPTQPFSECDKQQNI